MAYAHPSSDHARGQSARFAIVANIVTSDPELSPLDVRVFNALASHRNAKSGLAWPKRKTIAKLSGDIHSDTVGRCLSKLQTRGHIVKVTDGRGRGRTTTWRFPVEDARQEARQAKPAQPEAQPQPKRERKPRIRKAAPEEKHDEPIGFCGPTLIEEQSSEELTPKAPLAPETAPEPETPPAFGVVEAGAVEDTPTDAPAHDERQETPQAPTSAEKPQATQAPRLVFPEAFKGVTASVMRRYMDRDGLTHAEQQAMVDEIAFNARHHGVPSPVGYLRRLLQLRREKRLTLEVAHLEVQRREHIAANQAIIAANEKRHLDALARQEPPTPTLPTLVPKKTDGPSPGFFDQLRHAAKFEATPAQRAERDSMYCRLRGIDPSPKPPEPRSAADIAAFEAFRANVAIHRPPPVRQETEPDPVNTRTPEQQAEFDAFQREMAEILARKGREASG